ncbi:MAG: hypothetical protein O3A19_09190 [Planctomycetota bacterium]|nr:hypothetical protein [Planctomycetota bacterium]
MLHAIGVDRSTADGRPPRYRGRGREPYDPHGSARIRTDAQGGRIFSIHAPNAELVELTANFNGHRERTLAMRRGADGEWVIRLHPGLICDVYRFRINGRFVLDPDQPVALRGLDGIERTICPPTSEDLGSSGISKTA